MSGDVSRYKTRQVQLTGRSLAGFAAQFMPQLAEVPGTAGMKAAEVDRLVAAGGVSLDVSDVKSNANLDAEDLIPEILRKYLVLPTWTDVKYCSGCLSDRLPEHRSDFKCGHSMCLTCIKRSKETFVRSCYNDRLPEPNCPECRAYAPELMPEPTDLPAPVRGYYSAERDGRPHRLCVCGQVYLVGGCGGDAMQCPDCSDMKEHKNCPRCGALVQRNEGCDWIVHCERGWHGCPVSESDGACAHNTCGDKHTGNLAIICRLRGCAQTCGCTFNYKTGEEIHRNADGIFVNEHGVPDNPY